MNANFDWSARLPLYWQLIRGDRPIGTLLLLWPTLIALWWAAGGVPPPGVFFVFVVGTFLMRSAGCAINDWADRDFDAHVERTRERPLAAGKISPQEALKVAAVLAGLAFLLVLPLGWRVVAWSVPALVIAATYPFTKRFLPVPQAYLGVAFSFGIPMAWVAIRGETDAACWTLFAANFFWTIAYDTEYAMADRPDDLKLPVHSSAITFGRWDVLAVFLCYLAAFVLWARAGILAGAGAPFLVSLVVAAGIAAYHLELIGTREPARCFKAFLHNNYIGLVLFAGVVLDLWRA